MLKYKGFLSKSDNIKTVLIITRSEFRTMSKSRIKLVLKHAP